MQPYTWTMLLLMASAGVASDFATERPDTINLSQFLPVSSCVTVVLGLAGAICYGPAVPVMPPQPPMPVLRGCQSASWLMPTILEA